MNILIIQILRLGDALQMIPIIKGLKAHIPGSRISIVTSTVGQQVFEREPDVDEVYVLDKQKIAELTRRSTKRDILSALTLLHSSMEPVLQAHWDWVINFSFSFPSALMSFLLDAKRRSGYAVNQHRQYLPKEHWLAHSLASFTHRRYSNFNWVDIDRMILGLPAVPRHPLVRPSRDALLRASTRIEAIGFKGKRIIGMNPGASGSHKMWPLAHFSALAHALTQKHDFRVLLFGGTGEVHLGRALKAQIGEKAEDLSGKTTLDDLAAYLTLCDTFVTNDTGPMHLAYSVGTRVIGLFFNTHFVETGPYAEGHVAIHPSIACFPCQGPAACPHKKCLTLISPEAVESILLQRERIDGSRPDLPLGTEGAVQIHASRFDQWGMLDWIPLNGNPTTFNSLERLLLRVSWLNWANGKKDEDGNEGACAVRLLATHGIHSRTSLPEGDLESLVQRLGRFRGLIEEARNFASHIHLEISKPNSELALIHELGAKLGCAEKAIHSFEQHSSISFISELLTVFLEGIEITNMPDLSTRTLKAYNEILRFTDLMIANAQGVMNLFVSES